MSQSDLLPLIGSTIVRKNPNGTLSHIKIRDYNTVQYLLDLQAYGFTLIKPMARIDEGCEACQG